MMLDQNPRNLGPRVHRHGHRHRQHVRTFFHLILIKKTLPQQKEEKKKNLLYSKPSSTTIHPSVRPSVSLLTLIKLTHGVYDDDMVVRIVVRLFRLTRGRERS